jgi:hypothetical protein
MPQGDRARQGWMSQVKVGVKRGQESQKVGLLGETVA